MANTKNPKKSKKTETVSEEKNGQKPIVIKETEEDVALGVGFLGDPEDFKDEVKKEANRNAILKRFVLPLLFFIILGGAIGFATWYYSTKEGKDVPVAEDKIQTPPTVDETQPATSVPAPAVTAPATPPATTPSKETTYAVKEGDTLSTIANANGMTSAELASYNGITDPNSLKIGQVLKIPAK